MGVGAIVAQEHHPDADHQAVSGPTPYRTAAPQWLITEPVAVAVRIQKIDQDAYDAEERATSIRARGASFPATCRRRPPR